MTETNFKSDGYMPDHVLTPKEWLANLWMRTMMVNSGYLIPIGVLRRTGPYDESLTTNNDFDFFTRVALSSEGIIYVPKSKVHYRVVDKGLSQRRSYSAQKSVFLARKKAVELYKSCFAEDYQSKVITFYAYWNLLIGYLPDQEVTKMIVQEIVKIEPNYKNFILSSRQRCGYGDIWTQGHYIIKKDP